MVAQDERIGAAMITISMEQHGLVAVDEEEEQARYTMLGHLNASRPAKPDHGRRVRVLVEVQRRFGGLAPRALLGGEFTPDPSGNTLFEVNYAADGESVASCPSRLWKRPFTAGLPEEFASAVLTGLTSDEIDLPAGTLRVDRAGFDEIESSTAVFRQAAQVLTCALGAMLRGVEPEVEIRSVMRAW